jgi:hypothetical protein
MSQEPGETLLEVPKELWSCEYLDLGPLASRTAREGIPDVLVNTLCGICCGCPRKPMKGKA